MPCIAVAHLLNLIRKRHDRMTRPDTPPCIGSPNPLHQRRLAWSQSSVLWKLQKVLPGTWTVGTGWDLQALNVHSLYFQSMVGPMSCSCVALSSGSGRSAESSFSKLCKLRATSLKLHCAHAVEVLPAVFFFSSLPLLVSFRWEQKHNTVDVSCAGETLNSSLCNFQENNGREWLLIIY